MTATAASRGAAVAWCDECGAPNPTHLSLGNRCDVVQLCASCHAATERHLRIVREVREATR